MLYLLTVPANNTRGPRYLERALAALHQARLQYAVRQQQVGLMIGCHPADRDAVLEPIIASYPHASIATIPAEEPPPGHTTWSAAVHLRPELYPILRHAQFEDLLNHTFADPVSGLLRSIFPTASVTP